MTSTRKVVAITQRVMHANHGMESRDALDQSWTDFAAECGWDLIAIPNRLEDPISYLERREISAVILSGGGNISAFWKTISDSPPNVPKGLIDISIDRDLLECRILRESVRRNWPVIGVCRGMQFINLYYDGGLQAIENHVGVYHKIGMRNRIPIELDKNVNSYHDYGVSLLDVGEGLQVIAELDDHAEAFVHETAPHMGIMWHPERNSPYSQYDIDLFTKFLSTGCLYE